MGRLKPRTRSVAPAWIAVSAAIVLAAAGCGGARRPILPAEPAAAARTPPPEAREDAAVEPTFHVVLPGETLWRIARRYGVDWEELARVNGIEDATAVEVGTRLRIPGTETRVPAGADPAEGGTPPVTDPLAVEWTWPVERGTVISKFGAPRGGRTHRGIDIGANPGESVLAARDGRVVYSGAGLAGYGKTVILEHGDGWRTLYAHNSKLLVSVGDPVRRGHPIAEVGRTGNATGPHCHFEARRLGIPVDPLPFFSATARSR